MAGFKKRTSPAEATQMQAMAARLASELPANEAASPATPVLSPEKVAAVSSTPAQVSPAPAVLDFQATSVVSAIGSPTAARLVDVPVEEVRENPWNARRITNSAKVNEYARSMKAVGQLTPAAAFIDAQGRMTLIDGHCRLRAAIATGLATLRVELQAAPASDLELYLRSRRMNTERAEQTPIDDALAWRQLLERGVFASQSAIAQALSCSEAVVSKTLAIADLPAAVVAAITDHPELLTLRALYELRLYWQSQGLDETLALIADAARRGLSAREIEARRRAAERGPQQRPRSAKRSFRLGTARGEIRRFDADGRLELSVQGLSSDALAELEERLVQLVATGERTRSVA